MTAPETYRQPVAVVTGGAGGIGSAICTKLAEAGLRVVVGYNRSAEAARRLVQTLPGDGHSARPAPVTDSAALTTLAGSIAKDYGGCDALVNCAGVTRFVRHSDLDSLDDELINTILATNVRGAFACRLDVRHKRVAVVDAVMTTGTTLNELARAFKNAGAASVENWVVARTLPPAH